MSAHESRDPAVSVLQLNSELQQAQFDLLSAHCAVHQLRVHYSSDDLARFGRRDVIRKSAEAASALHDFYAAIENKIPCTEREVAALPTPEQAAQAVSWLAAYMQEQHDRYLPVSSPLTPEQKASMWPYFSPALLDQVRVIELNGARVPEPPFFAQVRALGFDPPKITHMDSVTFLDVIAFNQQFTERALFHALVHTVQIQILGLEPYAGFWVRSFMKSRTHFTVPLEVQAFSLASKFSRSAPERFSVEEQVICWFTQNRY